MFCKYNSVFDTTDHFNFSKYPLYNPDFKQVDSSLSKNQAFVS